MIAVRFYFEVLISGVKLESMDNVALIVDDDRTERRLISAILRKNTGLSLLEAENGHDAIRILDKSGSISVIILDLEMPLMNGFEALEAIRKNHSQIPVIVLTGSADAKDAVKALKMGAADFLSKPVENARLEVAVRNSLKILLMSKEIQQLKSQENGEMKFSSLIGHDKGLSEKIKTGRKASACNLPVLVTGETGTGKELFARAIHGESYRAGMPFVAVNCGAIPDKLVESTLFGHEKGAFTGAIGKAAGKFQEANGGTIFLDEIGDLPLESQVKLLRVLQQQEVEPVGAGKPVSIDVRIISATNRNLAEEVKNGRFREDLYFRLNVLHIAMPSLRERKDDIPSITDHFIKHFCIIHHIHSISITTEAMRKLQDYAWPGNVRELENVINRAIALCEKSILEPEDLFLMPPLSSYIQKTQERLIIPIRDDGSFKSYRELEHEIVSLALMHHDNNMTRTAKVLGIAKSTLYSKIGMISDLKSD